MTMPARSIALALLATVLAACQEKQEEAAPIRPDPVDRG